MKISSGISFLITTPQATNASVSKTKFIQHCWNISCRQFKITGDVLFTFIFLNYDDRWINVSAKAVRFLISEWDKYFENTLQNYCTCEVKTVIDLVSSE